YFYAIFLHDALPIFHAPGGYFPVETETVLVIPLSDFETGRLSIGDREDLFVWILPPSQNVHCKLKACYCVRVIWPDLQVGEALYLDRPRVVTKHNNVGRVLRLFGGDEFAQRHRNLLSRCDAILAVENHRVRDVDHQHGRSLCLELRLAYAQIIFRHHETVNAMVDLRVTNRFSEIDLFKHVAELELPCFGIEFITLSGLEAVMITLLCLLQFPKNLLEASLADSLFCL